jgi:hypothetical protein
MSTAPTPPGTFVAPAATQETGKRRASRIPLDYFKRRTGMDRWKIGGCVVALLVVCGYFAWGAFRSIGEERYSRGPVTHHHASLECAACHEGFTSVTGVFGSKANPSVSDKKCIACHVGPDHHAGMKESMVVGCGACHVEHRGLDASLVRLPNSTCTSCHENLNASMTAERPAGSRAYANVITDFSTHASFQMPETDPGTVKFNHALHLNPGQVKHADDSGKFTYGRLATMADEIEVQRYKAAQGLAPNAGKDTPVQLTCGSCHQLDVGNFGFKAGERNYTGKPADLPGAAFQPRGAGAYYQPIVYEVACQACHPLTFDASPKLPAIPHRLQVEELKRFVEGVYLKEYAAGDPNRVFNEKDRPTRPIPGKDLTLTLTRDEARVVDEESRKKVKYLLSGATCYKCHTPRIEKGEVVEIPPANIPLVWQPHAHFNHVSHRAMDCRSCHPNVYPTLPDGKENPNASVKKDDINLPDIKNCQQCHAPAQTVSGKRVGGVRDDCTGCHTYHHGAAPLQGLGAAARDPKPLIDVQEFLNYGKK